MYALVIAEPLGEAGNRGARSRNAFVCMYIYIIIIIIVINVRCRTVVQNSTKRNFKSF